MARGITRKQLKQDEFVEAAFNVELWLEEHWRKVAAWAAGVALVAALIAGWFWWSARQEAAAGDLLARGLAAYHTAAAAPGAPAGAYDEALSLFESAAAKAGGSPSGTVATYYRGSTLLRMDRPAEAVGPLEEAAARSDPALAPTVKTMLAEAYARSGRTDDAVDLLREVARGSAGHAEHALLRLALVLREAGRADEARDALREIEDRYPGTPTAEEAGRMLRTLQRSSSSS